MDTKPRVLVYEVLPPITTKGEVAFSGNATFDGKSITIPGLRSAKPSSQLRMVK